MKKLVLLCLLLFVLVACERPAPTQPPTEGNDTTVDPNAVSPEQAGDPVDGQPSDTEQPVLTDTTTTDPVAVDPNAPVEETGEVQPPAEGSEQPEPGNETDTPRVDATATPEPSDTEQPTDTAGEETAVEQPADTSTEQPAETGTDESNTEQPSDPAPADTTPTNTPATHTVQAGENLYRIGLQYGISWVQLAEYNGLTDADQLEVGQEIQLPSSTPEPAPTPSPQTESTYVVQAGDNLYRIGIAYGINWTQIAEANGIVNPAQLRAGQTLKIPVEAPSITEEFSHVVQTGDTVFSIALQYGVSWTAVAEANDLASPYIIYPEQLLVIPSGG